MKNVLIKKDTHSGFRIPELLFDCQRIAANVIFTNSCRYDIGRADQGDINKLFGIGYFPSHHRNSVRFGWRYIIEMDAMEIMAYWYSNGQRKWEHICFCVMEKEHLFMLNMTEKGHLLHVYNDVVQIGTYTVKDVPQQAIGYLLRPYFGGNQKAPHDIVIQMQWL